MPTLNRKDGKLTSYGFACGYIETFTFPLSGKKGFLTPEIQLTLWRENGCYHIRSHNFQTHTRLKWECYNHLTAARREFQQQKKQIKQGILR